MTIATTNDRLILVDFSVYMFKAIFSYEKLRAVPPTFTCLSMIIGDLKKVGLKPTDTVIIAIDSPKGSWRKEIDPAYKGNRKEEREKHDIDWASMWRQFDNLKQKLDAATPFHVIEAEKLEADDIISYACRKFTDKECVVISIDADYEQLTAFPNVKLFSTMTKRFKHIKNPYLILTSKIKKEKSDNLITEIHNEMDFEKRHLLINLLSLPPEIEAKAEEKLNFLPEKEWNYELIPFRKLQDRCRFIYSNQEVVDFNKESKAERKKRIRIKRNIELKAKKKRKKEREKKREKKRKEKERALKKKQKLNKQKELFDENICSR